jgi:hypothetical protein
VRLGTSAVFVKLTSKLMQNINWLLLGLGVIYNGKLAISDTETGRPQLADFGVPKFNDFSG